MMCVLKIGPNFGVNNKVRHKPSCVVNYYHGHSFLVYEFFKIYNLNCDYINPADSRPIKCQILALFSSANQKIIITALLYFFSIGRHFLGLGNPPMIGR